MKTLLLFLITLIYGCNTQNPNYQYVKIDGEWEPVKYQVKTITNNLGDTLYEVQVYDFKLAPDYSLSWEGYDTYRRFSKIKDADSLCYILNSRYYLDKASEFKEIE